MSHQRPPVSGDYYSQAWNKVISIDAPGSDEIILDPQDEVEEYQEEGRVYHNTVASSHPRHSVTPPRSSSRNKVAPLQKQDSKRSRDRCATCVTL
jgi:hypothetical protein